MTRATFWIFLSASTDGVDCGLDSFDGVPVFRVRRVHVHRDRDERQPRQPVLLIFEGSAGGARREMRQVVDS